MASFPPTGGKAWVRPHPQKNNRGTLATHKAYITSRHATRLAVFS